MKTPVRGYAARRKWTQPHPAAVAAIVVVVVFGGLWVTGIFDPMNLLFGSREPSHRGMVAVPVSAVAIPAYTKITRDHLWNPKIGNFAVIYLRPEQITKEMKQDMNSIVGRVMDHDKPPTYVFTESDFLPKGTKPGLVAGIPPGKRAMRIPVEKIPGLIGLLPGDRFDLVSTLPIDATGATSLAGSGLYGKQLDLQARLTNWQKQATVRVVVQGGDVVEPMATRQIPVSNTSLTAGLIVRYKPVQEVVIAVTPYEVPRLTEALAVGADISCVPRSGRPDDPRESITPESMPVSPFGGPTQPLTARAGDLGQPSPAPSGAVANPFGTGFTPVETISGNKREIVATPVKR